MMTLNQFFNKNTFYLIIIGGLVCWILFMKSCQGSKDQAEKDALRKEILAKDKTIQEQNGSYRKLVNDYNLEKDLLQEVKSFNEDLAKEIKKNNEKILLVSKAVATFSNKLDQGINVTVTKDSSNGGEIISFVTRYPTDEPGQDWFIEYNGKVYTQTKKLDGEWKFNKLNLNVVLTEQENGLWSYRIDGPDYLKVDSIQVNSLPKNKIDEKSKIKLFVGAGYRTLLNLQQGGALTLNAGMEFNQKNLILVDAATNQYVGLTFLRKIGK